MVCGSEGPCDRSQDCYTGSPPRSPHAASTASLVVSFRLLTSGQPPQRAFRSFSLSLPALTLLHHVSSQEASLSCSSVSSATSCFVSLSSDPPMPPPASPLASIRASCSLPFLPLPPPGMDHAFHLRHPLLLLRPPGDSLSLPSPGRPFPVTSAPPPSSPAGNGLHCPRPCSRYLQGIWAPLHRWPHWHAPPRHPYRLRCLQDLHINFLPGAPPPYYRLCQPYTHHTRIPGVSASSTASAMLSRSAAVSDQLKQLHYHECPPA
jgi:hypothetical protein